MVSPEMARILWHNGGLDDFRHRVRGRRPDLDALLEALRAAGERWASADRGSVEAEAPEATPEWLSTSEVASRVGLTTRAVVLAIGEKRLSAEWSSGRWMVSREELEHFKAARAGRRA